jgi:hypothetical protein
VVGLSEQARTTKKINDLKTFHYSDGSLYIGILLQNFCSASQNKKLFSL